MADGKIKISELSEALQINNDAVLPYSQDNGGTDATFKGTIVQIARKVNEGVDFTNLETSNKKIVGAINQTLNNFAEEYDPTETYNTGDPTLHNGTLYKCKADNTTGTWDSSKWEEAKAVDFGSGGGGGSGHTILDDSGTALTQRTNLQFKGAYSEDNSTDDTTEVNVVREMTKAEFDLLSADEKTGLINITDITSGNDDRFQPVIYSEDEREIGVWTDGKPLYEKTFVFSSTLSCASNDWTNTEISSSNIERVVSVSCFSDSGTLFDFVGANRDSSNYIQIFNARSSSIPVDILVLQYTKTTDQVGSGQWTPQGVPSHHYSTDEQVVGTWIDGSTLYEKTLVMPNAVTITANGSWVSAGVSAPSGATVIKADIVNLYVTGVVGIFVNNDTQTIYLSNIPKVADITIPANTPITVRYTKSST